MLLLPATLLLTIISSLQLARAKCDSNEDCDKLEMCISDACVPYKPCGGRDASECQLPLTEGDGHCRYNSDCGEGLYCGQRNCLDFPENLEGDWEADMNCCVDSSTVDHHNSYPRDQAALILYNFKHELYHLDVTSDDDEQATATSSDESQNNLWITEEVDSHPGRYYLFNPGHQRYAECYPTTQRVDAKSKSDNRNEAQQWIFQESEYHKGYYFIINVGYPEYRLGMAGEDYLSCYLSGENPTEHEETVKYRKVLGGHECRTEHEDALGHPESAADCAENVRDAMKVNGESEIMDQYFGFFWWQKGENYCHRERVFGCPEGYIDNSARDYFQTIDDSTFWLQKFPNWNPPFKYNVNPNLPKRENECGWNGLDAKGKTSYGDHRDVDYCLTRCLKDPTCGYLSRSLDENYCHKFETCKAEASEEDWDQEWRTWRKLSVKGAFIDQLWRLQDIWTTQAVWLSPYTKECGLPQGCDGSWKQEVGTSIDFEKSMGAVTGVSKTMEAAAKLEIKKLELGASTGKTVTSEFNHAISEAINENYAKEADFEVRLNYDECIEIKQIQVIQFDGVTSKTITTGMEYYLETTCGDCDWFSGDGYGAERVDMKSTAQRADCLQKIKDYNEENPHDKVDGLAWYDTYGNCTGIKGYSGRGNHQFGLPGIDQWFTCALKDEDSYSSVIKDTDKDTKKESWVDKESSMKEELAYASQSFDVPRGSVNTPTAVGAKLLAGLGFCSLIYGAVRFYCVDDPQTKEFVTIP